MYKSKIYQVVSTLNKNELKRLELFLSSSFFNQDNRIIHYFNEIQQSIAHQIPIDKKAVFAALFPGKSYDEVLLRLCQSKLLKLIERFIVVELTPHDSNLDHIKLLEYYRNKSLWKPYQSHYKQLIQTYSISDSNLDTYQQKSQFLQEKIQMEAQQKKTNAPSLQEHYDSVSSVYMIYLLKTACQLLTEKSVYNYSFNLGFMNELVDWLGINKNQLNPIIQVYYAYYKMLDVPEHELHYENFVAELNKNKRLFSDIELRDLYLVANNYCIRKVNEGDKKYALLALGNYQVALQEGVLYEEGRLSQRTYNNIVALALKNGQWNWVEEFMETYTQTLRSDEQVSTYHLNRARLSYVKQEYDRALELLQGADFKPMLNNLSAKTLMIKLFYEMEEYDVLYYQLKAMRAFLYRNKIMGYHKKAFNSLIRYTQKLLRTHRGDDDKIAKIKIDIESEEIIWEKEWLLIQLDRLAA